MSGQIFISYRRKDSLGSTGRLYDRLVNTFPPDQIFIDIDTIAPGEDFVDAIERAVEKCDVLLAIIGKDWLQAPDTYGQRMLDNPEDFVRIEIRAALKRNILIIPVLVEGAVIPDPEKLPEDIRQLSRKNAIEISYTRFNPDADWLIRSLQAFFTKIEIARKEEKKAEEKRKQQERQQLIERPKGPKITDPPAPHKQGPENKIIQLLLYRSRIWKLGSLVAAILVFVMIYYYWIRPLDHETVTSHSGIYSNDMALLNSPGKQDTAAYFLQIVTEQVKTVLKDLRKPDGSNYDIDKDGLQIYTTIDSRMQKYAEEAVAEQLTNLQRTFMAQDGYANGTIWDKDKQVSNVLMDATRSSARYIELRNKGYSEDKALVEMQRPIKMRVFAWNKERYTDTILCPIDSIKYHLTFLQAGFMAMDPATGEVKAWVGGIGHTFFPVDHVNIDATRTIGSIFSSLLYCFAVDNGFSPCGVVSTAPQEFPEMSYAYDASGGKRYGDVSMKEAFARSYDNASLYILKQVGIDAFIDYAHKCGISSHLDHSPLTGLGACQASLYEMMTAYSMFAAGGINSQPIFISRILDRKGNLLRSFAPVQKEIINNNTAYKMITLMRAHIKTGAARSLLFDPQMDGDIAGKTGTTGSLADAWFIGCTPQLMAGVWVGCSDSIFRFNNIATGQGAYAAMPIWAGFMRKVFENRDLGIMDNVIFKRPREFDDCESRK